MRPFRLLACAAVLAVSACGFFSEAPPTEGDGSGPVVDSTAAAAVDDSAASDTTGAQGPSPAIASPMPQEGGATPTASDSLTSLLRELAAGQAGLAARLDSVDARLNRSQGRTTTQQDSTQAGAGQVIGEAGKQVQSFGRGLIWSVLVIVLFNYLIRGLTWVLDTLSERSVTRRLFYKRLVPVVRIVLWIFAAYLIVRVIFQVEAQGILAAAAAVGVAVGFAAQDLLKNLFGGIILVFDQPFQVGDKISVGGTYGEVVSIGLRSTRIVTADDNLVSVPNAQVVDDQVANANAGELNCQVVTDLYLPGFVDESAAKKIAFDAAVSSKYVFLNKPIVVLVKDEFKETFLTRIRVKAYVLDPRHEFLFQSDVTERARAGFREAGLVSPSHALRAYLDLTRVDATGGEGDGA